jgi:hypothetical protein
MFSDACKACIRVPVLQSALAWTLCGALAACSSMPAPTEQVAAARTMVAQAAPVASHDGAVELKTAQAKLARAEEAMQRGDYRQARMLAEQAEVDARYAWTLAENARMQRSAAELDQSVKLLRNELDRRVK